MRTIASFFGLALLVVWVMFRVPAGAPDDHRFVRLTDATMNAALAEQRAECGVLSPSARTELEQQLKTAFATATPLESNGEIMSQEVVDDVVDQLLQLKILSEKCVIQAQHSETVANFGPFEGTATVVLVADGDLLLVHEDQPLAPWSRVMAEDAWRPDTIVLNQAISDRIEHKKLWDRMRQLAQNNG